MPRTRRPAGARRSRRSWGPSEPSVSAPESPRPRPAALRLRLRTRPRRRLSPPRPARKDRFALGGLWWLLGAAVLAAALIAVFASGSFDNDEASTPSASTTATTTATATTTTPAAPARSLPTPTTPSATPSGGSGPAIARINREIRLRGVTFVTGSAELTPASRTTLDRIAGILAGAAAVRAEVQGHTDDQGDAAANLALSRRRAEAVVAYLAGKGIARNRLVPRGFGETQPVASNATDAGRARNRRVVFRRL